MLSLIDKFLIVSIVFIAGLESAADGLEAFKENNWVWFGVCGVAAAYTIWLGYALLNSFFDKRVAS